MDAPSNVAPGARAIAMRSFGRHVAQAAVLVLDVVLVAYAFALVLIVVTGGVNVGPVTLNNAAKPILILAVAVPLRLVLPAGAWPGAGARWTLRTFTALRLRASVSAAVIDVAFAILATRMLTLFVAFVANLLFPAALPRGFMPFENRKFIEVFAAWDSGWYFDIASRGYYFSAESQSSVAFFPLYPTAMWLVSLPFGGSERAIWLAGIGVSLVSFALALHALHTFTHQLFGEREIARRAVLYLAVFPFSLFFSRVYTESLFLLTTVLAICSAHNGQWWRAGGWGAAATLTRPNGILILVPLVLMALTRASGPHALARRAAALTLVPTALAGYCAYVYTLSGDPLAWLTAQSQWGYTLGHPPWQQLLKMIDRLTDHGLYGYFFVTPMAPYRLLHGIMALLFLALLPRIFTRLGVPLGAYVLVSLLVPLTSNALEGVGRYAAVLFPAFMLLATGRSARVHEALLITSALLLALLNCLFVTLHPIY